MTELHHSVNLAEINPFREVYNGTRKTRTPELICLADVAPRSGGLVAESFAGDADAYFEWPGMRKNIPRLEHRCGTLWDGFWIHAQLSTGLARILSPNPFGHDSTLSEATLRVSLFDRAVRWPTSKVWNSTSVKRVSGCRFLCVGSQ